MKFLFSIVLCFLISCTLILAASLDDLKKKGIEILKTQVADIKLLTDQTVTEAEKAEGNVKIIAKHEKAYGDGIYDTTLFQMSSNAKSGYMLANLLGSANTVFRCIEQRHREGKDEADTYYNRNFLKPGQDYEAKAEQAQRDTIKSWKDSYYKAIDQYNAIYDRGVTEIQRATSESQIQSVVNQFGQRTKEMANIVTTILPNLNKIHLQIFRIFENLIVNFQKFSNLRIQKTADDIVNCFPKNLHIDSTPLDLLLG